MEDGIPIEEKERYRPILRGRIEALSKDGPAPAHSWLRVNSLEDRSHLELDIAEVLHPNLAGIIAPMVDSGAAIREFDTMLAEAERRLGVARGHFRIMPIIERSRAFLNVGDICEAVGMRRSGVICGFADLASGMTVIETPMLRSSVRSKVALAGHAYGLVPVDGVHVAVNDFAGFWAECEEARALGYRGKAVITPTQARIATLAFSRSPSERRWADSLLAKGVAQGSLKLHQQSNLHFFASPQHHVATTIAAEAKNLVPGYHVAAGGGKVRTSASPVLFGSDFIGLNFADAKVGSTIEAPTHVSVNDGFLAMWDAAFLNVWGPSSSTSAARLVFGEESRGRLALSHTLLVTLAATLAVPVLSHHAVLHVGFFDAEQLRPAYSGSDFKVRVRIDGLYRTKSDKVIVDTVHELLEIGKDESQVVFRLVKRTLFDAAFLGRGVQELPFPPPVPQAASSSALVEEGSPEEADGAMDAQPCPPSSLAAILPKPYAIPIREGVAVAHAVVKFFGDSEVALLSMLTRATNDHHIHRRRFTGTELVVPGPFVLASTIGAAKLELGPVLAEAWDMALNINRVNPEDVVSAFSVILRRRVLSSPTDASFHTAVADGVHWGDVRLEELHVLTFGLKNVDIHDLTYLLPAMEGEGFEDCSGKQRGIVGWPEPLTKITSSLSARDVELLIQQHCPMLTHQVASLVRWRCVRALKTA